MLIFMCKLYDSFLSSMFVLLSVMFMLIYVFAFKFIINDVVNKHYDTVTRLCVTSHLSGRVAVMNPYQH